MKTCILSTVDLSRMSMSMIYTDYFEKQGIAYDIIFVDKYGEYWDNVPENLIPLHTESKQEYNVIKKVSIFWKLRKPVLQILKKNNYDLIVAWNEVTALIFGDLLFKWFPQKYIINIRDYQYLEAPIIKSQLKWTIENSYFSTVSSSRYLNYLPKADYIFLHSMNKTVLSKLSRNREKAISRPITIVYIGQIGWLDNTYKFIDALANNTDFILKFIGVGAEKVDEYIDGKNYTNIQTYGRFKPEETSSFLKDADIIYNLYGYGNKHLDAALSIKLYYAIYLGIPILTFANTCTDEIAKKCGIAYTVSSTEKMKEDLDCLYSWYQEFNISEARIRCDQFINKEIVGSHRKFEELLNKYFQVFE